MTEKITLEEHVLTEGFLNTNAGKWKPDFAEAVERRIWDTEELRLRDMDDAGIATQVLSLTYPGVQGEKAGAAVEAAVRSNDALAEVVRRHPGRYEAFAALPCQEPERAADELERCVRQLSFRGALVNGHTHGTYLDDESCWVIWERAEALGVPIYLHPTAFHRPPASLEGYPDLMGSPWGWAVETGSHALRLVASGLFDRFPGAQVILGHMGEMLPYALWRLDDRWSIAEHSRPLEKRPSEYVRENFTVTTAGVCCDAALTCAIANLGVENVMFSVDYPYQSAKEAADFIEAAPVDDAARELLCNGNARRILGLG